MASDAAEVEDKYDVPDDLIVPALDAIAGVRTVEPPVDVVMEATYFDTSSLALARAHVTLRRRTGGTDDAWHLKLPTGTGRREVHVPLSRARLTVPKELRDLVQVFTHGDDLAAIATLRTQRTIWRLLDESGQPLAELADDRVEASTPRTSDSDPTRWREWEVELTGAGRELLVSAGEVLSAAGARASDSPSKLIRALGEDVRAQLEPARTELGRTDPASELIQQRLAVLTRQLIRYDPLVRRDVPDSVHSMRVATRRLRSLLAAVRPELEHAVVEPLRDELKWFAGILGAARDAEVMHARLRRLLAGEPDDSARRRAQRRVDAELGIRYRSAHTALVATMGTDRYRALLLTVEELASSPPWTDLAHEQVRDVLPGRVRHELKRLRRRVASVDDAATPDERDSRLHEARKAAKRLRYSVEPLRGVYGKDARQAPARGEADPDGARRPPGRRRHPGSAPRPGGAGPGRGRGDLRLRSAVRPRAVDRARGGTSVRCPVGRGIEGEVPPLAALSRRPAQSAIAVQPPSAKAQCCSVGSSTVSTSMADQVPGSRRISVRTPIVSSSTRIETSVHACGHSTTAGTPELQHGSGGRRHRCVQVPVQGQDGPVVPPHERLDVRPVREVTRVAQPRRLEPQTLAQQGVMTRPEQQAHAR